MTRTKIAEMMNRVKGSALIENATTVYYVVTRNENKMRGVHYNTVEEALANKADNESVYKILIGPHKIIYSDTCYSTFNCIAEKAF